MSLRASSHATKPVGFPNALLLAFSLLAACGAPEEASERSVTSEPAIDGKTSPGSQEGERSVAGSGEEGAERAETSGSTKERRGRVTLQAPNGPIDLTYEIIDGLAIAEGDIVVPIEIQSATRIGRRWDEAVVPYVIDPDLPEPSRVDAAIAHWQEKTNVRLVTRTTESDYLSFRPGTGCSSYIGRTGGKQAVQLSTGENAASVVAVGIDRANDRAYWFYRRGFATVGTTARADAHQAHFKYALPAGKTPADVVDVAFASAGRVVAWYSDGTVSEGTPSDLAKHEAPAPYTLAPGKKPQDVAAFAIDTAKQAHAFYKDGTFSTGTTTALDATTAPAPYVVASGKSFASLAHVDIAKDGTFHAFYTDGRTSSGSAADLGSAGALTRISFPGNCGVGSTIHEIGHAVGFFHEQTRNDRDDFVTINWSNIGQGHKHNFEKYSIATGNDTGPYDFSSIMHYDSFAFSANGEPTIIKVSGETFYANRTALSTGDIAAALFMYPGPPATP